MGKPQNRQSTSKQQGEKSRGGDRKVTKNMRGGGMAGDMHDEGMAHGGKVKDYTEGGRKR